MAIITLLTDFGTTDSFVGIMKGVILQINPHAEIVDISHGIEPQDVAQAANEVVYYYRYFPQDTVHLVVVDPGVGSDRAVLAMRSSEQILVAPDNGALSLVFRAQPKPDLVRVTDERYFLHPVSRTFHGRDIFAPVAAHLSLGLPLTALGQPMPPGKAIVLSVSRPRLSEDGRLHGSITAIDRFGNLITDVDPDTVHRFFPDADLTALVFTIGRRDISGVAESYSVEDPGKPLVLVGSRGCFEISVNRGSAARLFGVGRGDRFTVQPGRTHAPPSV